MLANLANDHKFAKFSLTKFYASREYNIDFEMECPQLDDRLHSSSRI